MCIQINQSESQVFGSNIIYKQKEYTLITSPIPEIVSCDD
jgi:hypothetical protein